MEDIARRSVECPRPIFTIGHSTRTLAEFLVPPFSVTEQVPLKGRGLAWPAGTEVTSNSSRARFSYQRGSVSLRS